MRSPFPSVLKRRLVGRRRRHGGLLLVHPQEGDMFGAKEKTADSRLQAVLVKLTGVLPKDDLGNQKIVSSDIIESVLGDSTPLPVQGWTYDPYPVVDDADGAVAVDALAKRLECELRAAKRTHLDCTEVLLPCGLLRRISRDIFAMAESEPCGLRGCTLYLCYENEDCKTLTTGTLKCDPTTASTFELYLTLKLSCGGWNSFLPQFIRNLTRGGSVVVSPAYTLSKKKLYRSYVD